MKCYRCKREMSPWPLQRPDLCSEKRWTHCIRWPNEKDRAHGATEGQIAETLAAGRAKVNLMKAMAWLEEDCCYEEWT